MIIVPFIQPSYPFLFPYSGGGKLPKWVEIGVIIYLVILGLILLFCFYVLLNMNNMELI